MSIPLSGLFKAGDGLTVDPETPRQYSPEDVGMNASILSQIDSIAEEGIRLKAYPGCHVMILREGLPVYNKCFGSYTYEGKEPVKENSLYDLASLTKVTAPYWVSYPEMVKLAKGTPVIVRAGIEQDFKITPAQLEAAITPNTRALILCSPSNPTGSVYTKEELQGLAEVLAKHERVIVIADEIYEHINYIGKHQSIAQFAEIKDRVVIVNGVSKAYAMTGWRIGFIAGPEWIVKGVNKLQGQYTSGPCSVSQKAAEAAYTGTQAPVEEMRKAFERRRDLIVKLAKEIPGFEVNFPQGAFYLFPKCDSFFGKKDGDRIINNADDLAMYLLEVGHVACVGGTSFGAPECIRMSYATSDENIVEAMRRIKETLARLK